MFQSWLISLVSKLYSGLCHGLQHPNVLRAVYIDGHHYSSGFMTDLIAFATRLRNEGFLDDDLLVHLSEFVTVPLKISAQQAHSNIHGEAAVYE